MSAGEKYLIISIMHKPILLITSIAFDMLVISSIGLSALLSVKLRLRLVVNALVR